MSKRILTVITSIEPSLFGILAEKKASSISKNIKVAAKEQGVDEETLIDVTIAAMIDGAPICASTPRICGRNLKWELHAKKTEKEIQKEEAAKTKEAQKLETASKKAADKLAADQQKAAEKKIVDDKKAADKLAAEEKKAEDKRLADEKKNLDAIAESSDSGSDSGTDSGTTDSGTT